MGAPFRVYLLTRLEQLVGIFACIDERLYLVNSCLTVGSIGYAEPLGCGIEHLASSLTTIDEGVYHERDEELCLGLVDILLQELDELLL